jgi:hypothetical protein
MEQALTFSRVAHFSRPTLVNEPLGRLGLVVVEA